MNMSKSARVFSGYCCGCMEAPEGPRADGCCAFKPLYR